MIFDPSFRPYLTSVAFPARYVDDPRARSWQARARRDGRQIDEVRALLTHVNVQRSDTYGHIMVAADGHALTIVPVEFEDDDVLGLIAADVIGDICKEHKFKRSAVHVKLDEDTVTYQTRDGRTVTQVRTLGNVSVGDRFPDWTPIVPKMPVPRGGVDSIGVNHSLLSRATMAIGATYARLLLTDPKEPIVVIDSDREGSDHSFEIREGQVEPFAIVMPCTGRTGKKRR